jgi:hypothetical protein
MAVLARLAAIGITSLELLVLVGPVVALGQVVTGHREGCLWIVVLLVALGIIDTLRGGLVDSLLGSLLSGAVTAPAP